MDDHWANPAGRLWEFLNYMTGRASNQVQLLKACAEYLGVPPVLSKDLYEGLGELVTLPRKSNWRLTLMTLICLRNTCCAPSPKHAMHWLTSLVCTPELTHSVLSTTVRPSWV